MVPAIDHPLLPWPACRLYTRYIIEIFMTALSSPTKKSLWSLNERWWVLVMWTSCCGIHHSLSHPLLLLWQDCCYVIHLSQDHVLHTCSSVSGYGETWDNAQPDTFLLYMSEPFPVKRGVKQGDRLSPMFFNIFVSNWYYSPVFLFLFFFQEPDSMSPNLKLSTLGCLFPQTT